MDKKLFQYSINSAMELGRKVIPYGDVATYIPELANADKHALGIAVQTRQGELYTAGDCSTRFTIQSISKVISLCVALEKCGYAAVLDKVGMEPSGEAFNSIVELDLNSNKPYNPMINSGALAIADLLIVKTNFTELMEISRRLMKDPDLRFDEKVYQSEMATCARNRAIGWLLKSKDIISNDVEEVLKLYTAMCSMGVTAVSLANLALILANGGVDPQNGERLLSASTVKVVKTIMLTCGMYDGSGRFAVEVGFPTKSGVGGGLLSVVDKEMGIGIYGPSLDSKGNCIAGNVMLKYLSQTLNMHLFHS